MTPKIVITNPVHEAVRARLAQYGEVVMNAVATPWSYEEVRAHASSASAIMGFMTDRIDEPLLVASSKLRIVAAALKGFDNYDVQACTRANVWLSIVPDLLTEPTAELAIGLAIGLARHIPAGNTYVKDGSFAGWRAQLYGTGLAGSTVAVIGMGKVGSAILNCLPGFGCARILGVDPLQQHPLAESVELNDAQRLADYVFVAVPLTSGSRHLIDLKLLASGKAGQLLINVGRGSAVSEAAVLTCLRSGQLAGYAADVFEMEDWALTDRPMTIASELLTHPRTLFTPHLGSAVSKVRLAIEDRAADNIIAVLTGLRPPDAINTGIV
jgi:phosphonate dehydrogenase